MRKAGFGLLLILGVSFALPVVAFVKSSNAGSSVKEEVSNYREEEPRYGCVWTSCRGQECSELFLDAELAIAYIEANDKCYD